ncbi:MAG: cytochrome bc complex cytochrome b subunit [Chloroflexi bacterium]|nr:cytochrome bc complex cytochrome b subunit [Chloroflexota bacterium]
MVNLGELRNTAMQKISEMRAELPVKAAEMLDQRIRAITAGLSANELRAITRGESPTEKPNPRYKLQTKSFLFHLRPRYYQRASTWFSHTFRLGWLSVFTFFVETFTGIILMVFYTPIPTQAYADILNIMANVPFGRFMRDLHRLGAEMMVISVFLHMVRVYFTGSYKGERSFTWLTGVVLLLLTLLLSFSGYLLPWDQLAYWAVTIGTSMAEAMPVIGTQVNLLLRGAPDIGAGGLLRFYLLHVLFVPLIAILVISIHYYKVSREHSISLPASVEEGEMDPAEKKKALERVDFIPDLITHEIFLTSLVTFIMVLFVLFIPIAPLETHANYNATPLDTEAPWYFLWVQGMLKLGDKTLMGVILPGAIFTLLAAIPYIDRNPSRLARNRKLEITLGILFIALLGVLSYFGTPKALIEQPPATRIVQDMIPQEGEGEVRTLPFSQLKVGRYTTDMDFATVNGTPGLKQVMVDLQQKIKQKADKLPGAKGTVEIADVQVDGSGQTELKQVIMRIAWTDPQRGDQVYEKVIFLHRDAAHTAK